MADRDLQISTEPLWTIPVPIQDRLKASLKDREYQHFLLCGLYSAVAISFLVLFGLAALVRGEIKFAEVIFGFAVVTLLVYSTAWYSHFYRFTKHLLTLLMGLLCVYLFYTGGTENTGPLFYFVFPLVAIFLQGMATGLGSVIALLVITLILHTGAFSFQIDRYSDIIFERIMAVYCIVSMLAVMFEYFRVKAERDLLVSIDDLNQLIYGDLTTSMANRRLLEKLLVAELARIKRYHSDYCILFIEPDYLHVQTARYGSGYATMMHVQLAKTLQSHLRETDIAGCWDDARFLVLMPQTMTVGAFALAQRVISACRNQSLLYQGAAVKFTISVGVACYNASSADQFIAQAAANLSQARREGGDRVVMS